MKLSHWLLTATLLAAASLVALAQPPFIPGPRYGGELRYSRGRLSISAGFVGPIGPFGYNPYLYRRSITQVSVYSVITPPPIIVIQRPIILEGPPPEAMPPEEGPPEVPAVPPAPEIPPMVDKPPPLPPQEEMVLPPPPPKPKPPKKGEGKLPPQPEPFDDPVLEYRRQIDLGRNDFVAGEYGRAAQRFRRANALQPREGLPLVLVAQAMLASGKFHEAAEAVRDAVRLWPKFPTTAFRAIDIYGPDVAAYTEHLKLLEKTRELHPNDPVLMFLSGYQAWVDGRRDEAAGFFRGLAGKFDAETLEAFLRALPGDDVV
jgi:hypothetical protein